MNLNLKNLQIELIDGSVIEKDLSKEIANLVYQSTSDIGMLDVAMTLYKTGCVEIDENQGKIIKKIIDENVKAFIKKSIFKQL